MPGQDRPAPPTGHHVADFGGEIRTLAEDRVTVDAGLVLPDPFACCNAFGQRFRIRRCAGDVKVAVRRQPHKDDDEKSDPP